MDFSKWSYFKYYMFMYSKPDFQDLFSLNYLESSSGIKNVMQNDVKSSLLSSENRFKNNKGNSIYVHIPFCVKQCEYCRWITVPYDKTTVVDFVNALHKEIEMVSCTPYAKSTVFESLYFGGGTPSTLSAEQISGILGKFRESFSSAPDAEISFEANPSTLTREKIAALKAGGVTRISLGVQTFNEEKLKLMDCAHNISQTYRVIDLVLKAGFTLNVDFMYGFADQSIIEWEQDLEELCRIAPQQVTLYPVRIFPGSKLYKRLKAQGGYNLEEHDERCGRFRETGEKILGHHSYVESEFPFNFYKKGSNPPRYVAIQSRPINMGPAAASQLDNGETRNENDVGKYIEKINSGRLPVSYEIPLSAEQVFQRFILMRIIYTNPKMKDYQKAMEKSFNEFYGIEIGDRFEKMIKELQKYDMICVKDGLIVTTQRLWELVDNSVVLY